MIRDICPAERDTMPSLFLRSRRGTLRGFSYVVWVKSGTKSLRESETSEQTSVPRWYNRDGGPARKGRGSVWDCQ